MAVNFYGSCNGSSGQKYNIWVKVLQNSQSVESNKSNISVWLYLKRNDGYANSAYNLNESDNSVKLSVGGSVKVQKNISVDTRNSATVTLANWSGDVSHNDDGTLDLAISGSFTMAGTSLTTGNVTGEFSLTDIPRASTLSFDKNSFNPLETVKATVTAAASGFSHKINIKLGDRTVSYSLETGKNSIDITVPKSWAELITESKYKNVSVELVTYKGSKKIGGKIYKLKLVIPKTSDYLPEFVLNVERIEDNVPLSLDEYVKGQNRVKLSVSGINLKYGATVSGYVAKAGSLTKNKVPATFDLNEAGNITVSVKLQDSRGYAVTKSTVIKVRNYNFPGINIKKFYRCDENGVYKNDGETLFIDCQLLYSSVNSKNSAELFVKYRKTGSGLWSSEALVSGPGMFFQNALDYGSSYEVCLIAKDLINGDGVEFKRVVSSSNIPFNIKSGGNGAAFGCFAERDGELTVDWNLNILGDLVYEEPGFSLNEEKISAIDGDVRYIPCLHICFIHLRVRPISDVTANSICILGNISKAARFFVPLNIYADNDYQNALKGGIRGGTGELFIKTSRTIPAGEKIYLSGFFFCDL